MMHCGVISPNMERPSLQKQTGPITQCMTLMSRPWRSMRPPQPRCSFRLLLCKPRCHKPHCHKPPIQTPLPGLDQMYNIPTGPSDYALVSDSRNGGDMKPGRPSPYMPPPSPWMNQRPLGVDVNVAYVEGREDIDRGAPHQPMTQDFFMISAGKRKRDDYASHLAPGGYMPQQDGSGDVEMEFVLQKETNFASTGVWGKIKTDSISNVLIRETPTLPQQDGAQDEYDELFHFQEVTNEDYNTPTPAEHDLRAPTPLVGTPKPTKNEAAEDDEPPLNEDDDDEDDLDDFDQGEEETNTQHLVLAQFDKVTRTKNKWKCALKDGIMHINSRDILFNKANGEFDF
ncbi:hypothetical protein KFK09_017008 [Dendrobium nobile]|uniref:Uncharacterized protein n=1 Tax=Dendrobium nobile TaxID=94219 RepID=A0A8T3AZW1_DENNO|nr:hypothetical protein KFK09_017008 [Dendrobium nobile]